jgi:hypothetical protein
MNATVPPLKLRVYAGRENGLMIIGKAESLSELGRQLQSAVSSDASEASGWPLELVSPSSEGPYLDVPEFKLSFHVEAPGGLPDSLRIGRRNLSPAALLVVGVLAIVGSATIFQWIAGHAL